MSRNVNLLVIHCTATPPGLDVTRAQLDAMHRARGWAGLGYHWIVRLSGRVEAGRPESEPGSHVKGWNARSIGIAYVGGLDLARRPADTRTPAQRAALARLVRQVCARWPGISRIVGHRDLSPDRDGDGKVEPQEWLKACPCFDVAAWLAAEGIRPPAAPSRR